VRAWSSLKAWDLTTSTPLAKWSRHRGRPSLGQRRQACVRHAWGEIRVARNRFFIRADRKQRVSGNGDREGFQTHVLRAMNRSMIVLGKWVPPE
jgi:hypothetical protein